MNNEMDSTNQSQRILKAAFKCISLKGYANVSLRNIADEAEVALSQLNYYYKNKEGLFIKVVNILTEKYLHEIEDSLKKGKSQNENISNLIDYFEKMVKNTPELFKLLFDLTSMALWSASLKKLINNLFNSLIGLIEKYIINNFSSREKLKDCSSRALSKMIFSTIFGTSIQAMLANEEEKEGIVDSLSALKIFFK